MAKSSLKNLSIIGINNSYNIDVEDVFNAHLPFCDLFGNEDRIYEEFISPWQSLNWDNRKKEVYHKEVINEATRKELLNLADGKRKARAKKLTTKYKGVTEQGYIEFETTSQYTPKKVYKQLIRLDDVKDIHVLKGFKKQDVVRLLLSGDLSIYCSCPDFLYRGYKYMAYNMDYGIFKENRFPKVRNPDLQGSICKHLIAVMAVIMFNRDKISFDLYNSDYMKRRLGNKSINRLRKVKQAERRAKSKWQGIGKFRKNKKQART